MRSRLLFLLCLTGLLAGCATVADLRSQPPDKTMESNLSPEKIANCVQFKAPAEVVTSAAYYHFSLSRESNGTFHLLAEIPNQPSAEATFQPTANGGSHIELRSRWNFWGKEAFWDCIQHCASPQNSPGA